MEDMPDPESLHSHLNGVLDGKLGILAHEIAEETARKKAEEEGAKLAEAARKLAEENAARWKAEEEVNKEKINLKFM